MSCFSKRGRLPEKITTKFSFQIMRKLPAHIPSPMEEEDDLLFILPCSTEGQESCIMTLKGYFLLLFFGISYWKHFPVIIANVPFSQLVPRVFRDVCTKRASQDGHQSFQLWKQSWPSGGSK